MTMLVLPILAVGILLVVLPAYEAWVDGRERRRERDRVRWQARLDLERELRVEENLYRTDVYDQAAV